METKRKTKKSIQVYMRDIHRILGYLAVGLVMVYALSGITLIHRTGDFMKKGIHTELTLASDLSVDQLAGALKIKNLKITEETDQTIYFADGQYDKSTGKVSYVKKEVISPLNKFIDLHKLPEAKNHHIAFVTTLFGVVLFLLALTSLFMYKPSSRQFKANMIYASIGIVLTIILVILA